MLNKYVCVCVCVSTIRVCWRARAKADIAEYVNVWATRGSQQNSWMLPPATAQSPSHPLYPTQLSDWDFKCPNCFMSHVHIEFLGRWEYFILTCGLDIYKNPSNCVPKITALPVFYCVDNKDERAPPPWPYLSVCGAKSSTGLEYTAASWSCLQYWLLHIFWDQRSLARIQ